MTTNNVIGTCVYNINIYNRPVAPIIYLTKRREGEVTDPSSSSSLRGRIGAGRDATPSVGDDCISV